MTACLLWIAAAGGMAQAQAATLATVDFMLTHSVPLIIPGPAVASDEIVLYFAYSLAPGDLEDPTTQIFNGTPIAASDSGRLITLTSVADDPEYTNFFSRAVNGQNDDLRVIALGNHGGGSGLVAPETSMLELAAGITGPDLTGYTVSGIELFLGDVFIDPSAGISQLNWSISGQFRILGEPLTAVPVPAAFWLLAGTLPWLYRRTRKVDNDQPS